MSYNNSSRVNGKHDHGGSNMTSLPWCSELINTLQALSTYNTELHKDTLRCQRKSHDRQGCYHGGLHPVSLFQ